MKIFFEIHKCKAALSRSLMLLLMLVATLPVFAQQLNKLSVTTQMFLDEQAGNITFQAPAFISRMPASGQRVPNILDLDRYVRPIASPVTKNGQNYISAFIRVTDSSVLSTLERLGVEIQCEFCNGTLYTTLIPVDKILEVAKLTKVTHINVAKKMRPLTNAARQYSNVDDVLTFSESARQAGLPNAFDGSGVLLGVIDTGIDFQHKAFKDANGNSRIKRAYVVTSSGSAREYGDGTSYAITTSQPTTDDSNEDHGTHTSSTAGGSSVILSGSYGATVTVTTDHANATYGGMAPGADLYLAGCDLSETYLANAFQKICNYADSKNMPVVVSNSWGGQFGPHDGTGDLADVVNQYFGDTHPNHICLFAASNDAGTNGFHVYGTASSSSPLGTVMNYNSDYGLSYYYGILANAWCRTPNVRLNCKVIVLKSNGTKVSETTVNPSNGSSTSVNISGASGSLTAYRNYVSSSKSQILLNTNGLQLSSGYKLAVQFYPATGSSVVDIWSGSAYTYFTNTPSTSGYTWTKGSDDMCVSDEATYENAISIGAYSTKNAVTDHYGTNHQLDYTFGDIAYFSSWATAAASPTGQAAPWISAPGATVVSGVNAYHTTTNSYNGYYSYIDDGMAEQGMYRVNNDKTNPYGSMEGTSMATPAAAGIVALWLQAAKSVGKDLTVNDVKEIMAQTAITDSYTNGTNRAHFGHGKIDALAGIQYILGSSTNPTIIATPLSLDFGEVAAGTTITKTFNVTGANLEGNISLALDNTDNFTISSATVTKATAEGNGATITVTFKPTAKMAATYNGKITLTSSNATAKEITLTGKGTYVGPAIQVVNSLNFGNVPVGEEATLNLNVKGTNLTGSVNLALTDNNGVYQLGNVVVSKTDATNGKNVTVKFTPQAKTTYNGTITLTSADATAVTVNLTGAGTYADPVMQPVDTTQVHYTSFRADWTDLIPAAGLSSYTLQVNYVPPFTEPETIGEADFSGLEAVTNSNGSLTNQSSNASTYLPSGWTVNNYLYIDDGAIIIREQTNSSRNLRTTVAMPDGTDKITVVVDCEAIQAGSNAIETGLTVTTVNGNDTETQMLAYEKATHTYVLNASGNEQIQFNPYTTSTSAWAYVGIYNIKIYAGDITSAQGAPLLAAVEVGDSTTRTITGITDKFYLVKDLLAGGTFTYKVKALFSDGTESAWSNEETVTLRQTPDQDILMGDVNNDGVVDVQDVSTLIDYILGKDLPVFIIEAANVNGDTTIDVQDVSGIIEIILGR